MIGVGTKLAQLWAAWKVSIVIAALLAASLYANYVQWRLAVTAELRVENRELKGALDTINQLAVDRNADQAALLARMEAIADRAERTKTVYRMAAASMPLASDCMLGTERVDAINSGLGPQTETAGIPPAE